MLLLVVAESFKVEIELTNNLLSLSMSPLQERGEESDISHELGFGFFRR